jgi:hypothetical protein
MIFASGRHVIVKAVRQLCSVLGELIGGDQLAATSERSVHVSPILQFKPATTLS